jgi:gliding motility-associated-like protein
MKIIKKLLKLGLILLTILTPILVYSSHIAGADITYKCIGQDSFEITVNVFRDCSGIPYINTSLPITISNTCNSQTSTVNIQRVNSVPIEVSQLCPSALLQSTCNNGVFPGMQQYIFKGIVVLTPRCNTWTIGHIIPCCRNTTINQPGSSNLATYIRATINTQTDSCNNSPVFSAQPIPYVCINQPVNYNFGVTEPDGDSLVYSFVCGFTNVALTTLTMSPPLYTCTSPIPGITISPNTGQVTFTPTTLGNFILVVLVTEYDKNGQVKGTVMRDIQIVVQGCTNIPPNPIAPISNFTGSGSLVNPTTIEVCIGEQFTFNVVINDPNQNDSLSLTSNVTTVLPGATFTWVNNGNSATATITWQATTGTATNNPFYIRASDNACPVSGIVYYTYNIVVVSQTFAGPDLTICFGDSIQLGAVGGNQFTWASITGPPLTPGVNFSDSTIQYPIAFPISTTSYQVKSNLITTCKNRDTITVFVVPTFTINISNDTLICSKDNIPIYANPSIGGNFTYLWNNTSSLNNATIPNPIASPIKSTTYTVTVTSTGPQGGCNKKNSVTISLSNPFPKNIKVTASDTLICFSDTVKLGVDFGKINPVVCGIADFPCIGYNNAYTFGPGQSVNTPTSINQTAFPTLFAGRFHSTRQQFLYRAVDLQSMGMPAGQIKAINVPVINTSGQQLLNGFTVRMGCTNANELSNTGFAQNLFTVRSPAMFGVTYNMLNTIFFDNPYEWDGVSNLIIEICFDNGSSIVGNPGNNAQIQHRIMPYNATNFVFSTIAGPGVCNSVSHSTGSPNNRLPVITFIMCSGIDSNNFNYSWSPVNSFISGLNTLNPSVFVTVGTNSPTLYNYNFYIQDTFGVCFDTIKFKLKVVDKYQVKPDSIGPLCNDASLTYLKVPTPWNITVPGGKFYGPGIIDDTLGLFNPGPVSGGGSGTGKHWIIYEVIGNLCENRDSVEIEVLDLPDATVLTTGPFCKKDPSIIFQSVNPGNWISLNGGFFYNGNVFNANSVLGDTAEIQFTAIIGNCTNDTIIKIPLYRNFDGTITNPGKFCPTDSTVKLFSKDSGGLWSGKGIIDPKGFFDPRVAGPGTHTIQIDSSGVCGGVFIRNIVVDTLPNSKIIIPPYFCQDNTDIYQVMSFLESVGYLSNYKFTWDGGSWMPLKTEAKFYPNQVVNFNGLGPHKLSLSVVDGNGCYSKDSIMVNFIKTPDAPKVFNDSFCYSEPMILVTGGNNDHTIFWSSDKFFFDTLHTGNVYNAGFAKSVDPSVIQKKSYWIFQSSPEGCLSNPSELIVTILPVPSAIFEVNTITGSEPLDISFINRSIGATTFDWNFGNGETSAEKDPTYTYIYDIEYDSSGIGQSGYYVILTVKNQFGCVDTSLLRIGVDAVSELIIPNIFTPNGDGINDFFPCNIAKEKCLLGLKEFEGIIYNRWGRKVATLTINNPSWNGEDDKGSITDGVYFYVIKAVGFNNTVYEESGNVTLIKGDN